MNASQCVAVRSSWIAMVILMCDNTLSVLFKGGLCCNYPATSAAHFHALLAAPSKGRWVRRHLFKLLPCRPIRLPCPPAGCGGIDTTCCPGQPIPATVHATVTGSGACDGTYALSYCATPGNWQTAQPLGSCSTPPTLTFLCNAGHWFLQGNFLVAQAASVTCSPLSIHFANIDFSLCGGGAGNVTVTT
jgi:hypothetical protein